MTSIPSTAVDTDTKNIPGKTDEALSVAPERRLGGGRPFGNTLDTNTPLTSAASEEKKVKV